MNRHESGEFVPHNRYPIYAASEPREPGKENQDAVLTSAGLSLVGIFDGAGGETLGEIASRTAVSAFFNTMRSLPFSASSDEVRRSIVSGWKLANRDMRSYKERRNVFGNLATTAVIVKVTNTNGKREAIYAQAGDSRLYVLRKSGSAKLLTFDEGVVHDELQVGYLTPERANEIMRTMDAAEHEDHVRQIQEYWDSRNQISNSLGSFPEAQEHAYSRPTIREYSINDKGSDPDIALLLVTDGITDSMPSRIFDEVVRHFVEGKQLKDLPKALVGTAHQLAHMDNNFRGKPDDMTAVVMGL